MTAPPNPYASPTTLDLNAPGAEWSQIRSPELAKTALGLALVYYGIVILLISMIMAIVNVMVLPSIMISLVGMIAAAIMMFVGPLFCLSVPAETGAKGLIFTSVGLQFVNLLVAMNQLVFHAALPQGVSQLVQLSGVVGAALFVLFMRKLAKFIGREDLAKRAGSVLTMGIVLILLTTGATIGAAFAPGIRVLGLVTGILGLIVFVRYADLVNSLRKALKPS